MSTKTEFSENDVIEIDPRSQLEVHDKKHRYGKNLRQYYKEWKIIKNGHQKDLDLFFLWLDSPESPEISKCTRRELEVDVVQYLTTEEERERHVLEIHNDIIYYRCKNGLEPLSTGSNGWICVLQQNKIYGHEKVTDRYPRFHHSSFFSGSPVQFAGLLVADCGKLLTIFPHSGHYRPTEHHLYHMLAYLEESLSQAAFESIMVDAQRIIKRARAADGDGVKAKKKDTPELRQSREMLDFLSRKHTAWGLGLFAQLYDYMVSRNKIENEEIDDVESAEDSDVGELEDEVCNEDRIALAVFVKPPIRREQSVDYIISPPLVGHKPIHQFQSPYPSQAFAVRPPTVPAKLRTSGSDLGHTA